MFGLFEGINLFILNEFNKNEKKLIFLYILIYKDLIGFFRKL